jgi:DNA repair protein RadC
MMGTYITGRAALRAPRRARRELARRLPGGVGMQQLSDLLPSPLARERLWKFGAQRVTDEELVAILLGTGMRGRPVWDVATDVVRAAGGLSALSRASPQEIIHTAGIGECRAVRVVAAFELGRRALFDAPSPQRVHGPEDVARLLMPRLAGTVQECFHVIAIDSRNQVIADLEIARGSLAGVEVHPREVFRPLIRLAAAAAIVAHNHPSGDPTPSGEDLELTRRLREVGELVGIPVLDHVIVAGTRYRSVNEWVGAAL